MAIDTRGKLNVCQDTSLSDQATCDADPGREWIPAPNNLCNNKTISTQDACTGATHAWVQVTSDFNVWVLVNTFTAANSVDLEGNGKNDMIYTNVKDSDGNGIPDDFDGDGNPDINQDDAISYDWDGDGTPDFFTYPYTDVLGSATATFIVTGNYIKSGDKATVTFVAGDGQTSTTVQMP